MPHPQGRGGARVRAAGASLAALIASLGAAGPALPQTTISGLPAGSTPTGSESLPADQNGNTVRLTPAQLQAFMAASFDGAGAASAAQAAAQAASLQKSANLSDLADAATARATLGAAGISGALTPGHCLQAASATAIADAGAACGSGGGGGGGAPAGSTGQLQVKAGPSSFGAVPGADGLNAFAGNPVTSGLIAEYPFTDGSGATVADVSGNGHTGTITGSAYAWSTYGLTFNTAFGTTGPVANYVQTDVQNWRTAIVHACAATYPGSSGNTNVQPFNQYPGLIGPAGTSDGVGLIGTNAATVHQVLNLIPTVWQQSGGSGSSAFETSYSGPSGKVCGTYTFALGSSGPDHIYVDGQEPASYNSQNASGSYSQVSTSSTGYQIGDVGSQSSFAWLGSIDYALFYSSQLSQLQAQQVAAYVNYKVSTRPGFPAPRRSSVYGQVVVCDGDSLTAGYNGTINWCSNTYTGDNSYTYYNEGVSGQLALNEEVVVPYRIQPLIPANGDRSICVVWLGTNDLAQGWSAQDAYNHVVGTVKALKASGCTQTIVATMISRSGFDGTYLQGTKNGLNQYLRAYGIQAADALLDLAAIPAIGGDGASTTNTSCFNADGVHLIATSSSCGTLSGTSMGGQQLVGQALGNLLNVLDGSNPAWPSTTVCPSNAYYELYTDNYLIAAPTASGCSIALPDMTGLTGQLRTIVNNSAYSINVVGSTEYYGNNTSAGAAPFVGSNTCAANTTCKFRVVLAGANNDPIPNLTTAKSYQLVREQ